MPPGIAAALRALGVDANTQAELFATPVIGAKSSNVEDDVWLRHLKPDDVVITRDIAIGKGPFEAKTVRIYKAGLFAIAGKKLAFWDIVKIVINQWELIESTAAKQQKPYMLRVPQKGQKLDNILR